MKWHFISMVFQAAAAAIVAGQAITMRPRHPAMLSYFAAFTLATILAFWQLREGGINSPTYKFFFAAIQMGLVVLMLGIGWQVTAEFPALLRMWFFGGAAAFAFACVSIGVFLGLPAAPLTFAAFLFVGGQAALWGSVSQEGVVRILTFGLGVLWSVSSSWHFAMPFIRAAHPREWKLANEWLPATLGFVILAAMAFYAQAELSRAATSEMQEVCAAAAVEATAERRGR